MVKKGVTLIEVLVASILLAISIGALLAAYIPNYRISIDNRMKTQADAVLISELEKIQTIKNNNDLIKHLYHTDGNVISSTNPIVKTIANQKYKIYYTLSSANLPYSIHTVAIGGNIKNGETAVLMQVETNVEWIHKGRQFKKSLITLNASAPPVAP